MDLNKKTGDVQNGRKQKCAERIPERPHESENDSEDFSHQRIPDGGENYQV